MKYIGKGLLQQIKGGELERTIYPKLTADVMEDFLFDLSYNINNKNQRKFVVLTGYIGMVVLDLTMQGMTETEFVNSHTCWTIPKRVKDASIVVDLNEKHGLYKAIALRIGWRENLQGIYKVVIRKGTKVIDEFKTFKEAFNKYGYPATIKTKKEYHLRK